MFESVEVISMSQLRNQLKDITFDNITAANIQTVGGRVYADQASASNVDDLVNVQSGWAAVHSPTFGQSIPGTGEWVQATVADTPASLVDPSGNEVYEVSMVGVHNETLGSLTVTITLSDNEDEKTIILASEAITAGLQKAITFANPVYIDTNAKLTVEASGASIACTAYLLKIVQ